MEGKAVTLSPSTNSKWRGRGGLWTASSLPATAQLSTWQCDYMYVSAAGSFPMWSVIQVSLNPSETLGRSILPPKSLPLGESSLTDKLTATGELKENCSSGPGLTADL